MVFISIFVYNQVCVCEMYFPLSNFFTFSTYAPPPCLGNCVYFSFISFDRKIVDFLPIR